MPPNVRRRSTAILTNAAPQQAWRAPNHPQAGPLLLRLADVQEFLQCHENQLPVRVVWLAALALYRLSGDDVLALTRCRDRLLERLHRNGLGTDLDLPNFLRFSAVRGDRFLMEISLVLMGRYRGGAAKVSVVSGALPEANHNDVMGLEGGIGPGRELVLLRDEAGEHDRDGRRIQAVLKAIGARDPLVRAAGKGSDLARLAHLTAFADFTSTYLGIARGVDPTPIRTLDQVKAALSAEADPPR